MPITRIFLRSPLAVGELAALPPDEAHHVYRVLRGRAGDEIEVVDGGGALFAAALSGDEEAEILDALPGGEDAGGITLYQAVPKGRHMDLVVEKATELGVERICPLVTQRGVVKVSPGDAKVERWRRVALAAARQSLRLRVPEVLDPVPLPEAVRQSGEIGVALHNSEGLLPLEVEVSAAPVGLFVGPEGGWSEEELELMVDGGTRLTSLGPFRLRSETAGIVAVARAGAMLDRVRESTGNVARSG